MVGDPFFPAIIAAYGAVSKGIKLVKAARAKNAMGTPPPSSSFVGTNVAQYIPPPPVRPGVMSGVMGGIMRTAVPAGQRAARAALPAGSRIQSFPAGVGAYSRRRRRINPLNIRALRRALRRTKGFEKIARKVLKPSHYRSKIHVRGRKR
jgi:hypothetical protein